MPLEVKRIWPVVFLVAACGPEPRESATLDEVQAVFLRRCAGSGCHQYTAEPLAEGLDLTSSAGQTYDNLVEVPSAQVPEMFRVTPGNVVQSYLYCKIRPSCAQREDRRMPRSGTLTPDEIEIIRAWIASGASR